MKKFLSILVGIVLSVNSFFVFPANAISVRYPKESYTEFPIYLGVNGAKLTNKVDGIGRLACGAVNGRQPWLSFRDNKITREVAFQAATVVVSGKFANQLYVANVKGGAVTKVRTTPIVGYVLYKRVFNDPNYFDRDPNSLNFVTVKPEKNGVAGEWEVRDKIIGAKTYSPNGSVLEDKSVKTLKLPYLEAFIVSLKGSGKRPLYSGNSNDDPIEPSVSCPKI